MLRTASLSVLCVACWMAVVEGQSPKPPITSPRPSENLTAGRFQVVPTTDDFFKVILVDTATGDTWTACLVEVTANSAAIPPSAAQVEEYLDGLIAADERLIGHKYSDRDRAARREALRDLKKSEIAALGTAANAAVRRKSWCVMPRTSGFGVVSIPR